MKKSFSRAAIAALALASPLAMAHQAGDIVVRAGAVKVDPHEKSSKIKAGGAAIAGSKATLNSNTQLGLNFAYMFSDYLGVELLAATPFKHNIGIKGVGGGLDGKLGTTRHLPPTLSLVYYPLGNSEVVQPYLGAGINYTWFFDSSLKSSAEKNGFSGLDVKDSFGWAAQIGMDIDLGDNFLFNAQMRYIDIKTTGTTKLNGARVKVDLDVDPLVYMMGVGYKF
ncbi:hypothetical protein AXE65_06905 [Ventosimonas gracilis]|uniref:Outer membrane protein OmpW n=1 Tax=Ventosimonas gracilis TaxID=1680762 RepID=A0A139SJ91_9GAMM|nr:OmpW family outer membrane protein [Ventosimonas gracilis]KXU34564.1 hypothetical protein AXE65_06905 [Ventosimonas gracilis]